MCFNDVFDLEKRHAAFESSCLGFLGERDDAPVVVGENNNGFAAQLRAENALTAAIEGIAVKVKKVRHRYLHTNVVSMQDKTPVYKRQGFVLNAQTLDITSV